MADQVHQIYGNRLRVRACGLLVENKRLLMVNHRSLAVGDFWAPPGGGVNFGESAVDSVRREMLEETGLVIEVGEFIFACEFIREPLHAIELYFVVRRVGGSLITGKDPEMKRDNQIIETVRFLNSHEILKINPSALHGIFRVVKEPLQITKLKGYFKV